MSNTRRAKPGTAFRQEKYASSPEFTRGLMANLVARRCELLENPADRELIWFLQLLSHSEGFPAIARELLALRNKNTSARERAHWKEAMRITGLCEDDSDPVETALLEYLSELCLNPATKLKTGPYFCSDAPALLQRYKAEWIERRRRAGVVTEIGKQVNAALEYALESHCMVLVDGVPRIGKTHAAKAHCELHPGCARYVEVPSTSDDIGFFRAIAKSLGVSINLNSKAQELRQRIEDVLQRCHLMLILDQAHYLWPNNVDPDALPGRINWLMAMVDSGVPVGLIATPQFIATQKIIEDRTRWSSAQFVGRIGHYERLPDTLNAADLFAVARVLLPEGDAASIDALVRYAKLSMKYLAAIESAVRRARFLANRAGRDKVTRADVREAINSGVIPSDRALASALNTPAASKRARRKTPAAVVSAMPHPLSRRGQPAAKSAETFNRLQFVELTPASS